MAKLTDEQVKHLVSLLIRCHLHIVATGSIETIGHEVLTPSSKEYELLEQNDDLTRFVAHLQWLNELAEDYFNLILMGSSSIESIKLQREEIIELASVFGNNISISLSEQKSKYQVNFTEEQALESKTYWEDVVKKLAEMAPKNEDTYFSDSNYSVADKLAAGCASQTEWLTEMDISIALRILECPIPVFVGPFDVKNLGTVLHHARITWVDQTKPLYVPCILNLASVFVQGVHWVHLLFIITKDPQNGMIQVRADYGDQLNMCDKNSVKTVIRDALNYIENPTDPNLQALVAFPKAQRTYNIRITQEQDEGWSCGYRAILGLLKNIRKNGFVFNNAILACKNTNDLRDFIYQILRTNTNAALKASGNKTMYDNQNNQNSSIIDLKEFSNGGKLLVEIARFISSWKKKKYTKLVVKNFTDLKDFQKDFFIQALESSSELTSFQCLDDPKREDVKKLLATIKTICIRNILLKKYNRDISKPKFLWDQLFYLILNKPSRMDFGTFELFYPGCKDDSNCDEFSKATIDMGVYGFKCLLSFLENNGDDYPFNSLHLKIPAGLEKTVSEDYVNELITFFEKRDLPKLEEIVIEITDNEESVLEQIQTFVIHINKMSITRLVIQFSDDRKLDEFGEAFEDIESVMRKYRLEKTVIVRGNNKEEKLGLMTEPRKFMRLIEQESDDFDDGEMNVVAAPFKTKWYITYHKIIKECIAYEAKWFVDENRRTLNTRLQKRLNEINRDNLSLEQKIRAALDEVILTRSCIMSTDYTYNRSHLFKRTTFLGDRFLSLLDNAILCLNNDLPGMNPSHS